jgi:hypothetical protein
VHIPASALLLVHDQPVAPLPILVAFHKPLGMQSTIGDPMGRPNLEDALPPRLQKSFHPVGRLDADTTGLLLFSGDGQLTQRLLHPSSDVQRQYVATVEGALWAFLRGFLCLLDRIEAAPPTPSIRPSVDPSVHPSIHLSPISTSFLQGR